MSSNNKRSPLPSTTFTLTNRDWKNTVIHGDDGKIVYWIQTDSHPRPSSSQYSDSDDSTSSSDSRNPIGTIVYRATARGCKEFIASLDFHSYDASSIYCEGRTRSVEEMFPKKNARSSLRRTETPLGECTWSPGKQKPYLIDAQNRMLASYSSNKHPFQKSASATLTIADLAIPFFDEIILGWIVEMRDIERGEKSAKLEWRDWDCSRDAATCRHLIEILEGLECAYGRV